MVRDVAKSLSLATLRRFPPIVFLLLLFLGLPTVTDGRPSRSPTYKPSSNPSNMPTFSPTPAPTANPTSFPTFQPTTSPPTFTPAASPSKQPTLSPSFPPTNEPTAKPSLRPTFQPTIAPSPPPSLPPTPFPTLVPTLTPTSRPSLIPTPSPSSVPTILPSFTPTTEPTLRPSTRPSVPPTISPTLPPTPFPITSPTTEPTLRPTPTPSLKPTLLPSLSPSYNPSSSPSLPPSRTPSFSPTPSPTPPPTTLPSLSPSTSPTLRPSTSFPTSSTASYQFSCLITMNNVNATAFRKSPYGYTDFISTVSSTLTAFNIAPYMISILSTSPGVSNTSAPVPATTTTIAFSTEGRQIQRQTQSHRGLGIRYITPSVTVNSTIVFIALRSNYISQSQAIQNQLSQSIVSTQFQLSLRALASSSQTSCPFLQQVLVSSPPKYSVTVSVDNIPTPPSPTETPTSFLPPTSSMPPDTKDSSQTSSSSGLIIGVSVCGAVVFLLFIISIYYYRRDRSNTASGFAEKYFGGTSADTTETPSYIELFGGANGSFSAPSR